MTRKVQEFWGCQWLSRNADHSPTSKGLAEWYAAEVGATPPTSWEQVVEKFSSRFWGGPPNEGSCNPQYPQDGKGSASHRRLHESHAPI